MFRAFKLPSRLLLSIRRSKTQPEASLQPADPSFQPHARHGFMLPCPSCGPRAIGPWELSVPSFPRPDTPGQTTRSTQHRIQTNQGRNCEPGKVPHSTLIDPDQLPLTSATPGSPSRPPEKWLSSLAFLPYSPAPTRAIAPVINLSCLIPWASVRCQYVKAEREANLGSGLRTTRVGLDDMSEASYIILHTPPLNDYKNTVL